MQSILEEFAYGNVSPEVRFFKRNSRYGEAMGALATNEEKLLGKLNGDEREIFQKFVDAQGEVNEITAGKPDLRFQVRTYYDSRSLYYKQ